jgi:hypothetical protein
MSNTEERLALADRIRAMTPRKSQTDSTNRIKGLTSRATFSGGIGETS